VSVYCFGKSFGKIIGTISGYFRAVSMPVPFLRLPVPSPA
jgi:hypothetical protein